MIWSAILFGFLSIWMEQWTEDMGKIYWVCTGFCRTRKRDRRKMMSRIILSCGHEVNDFGRAYHIMTKSIIDMANWAVAYQTVWKLCEDRYRQHGQIFDFEEVAYMWVKDFKEQL